jgi:hypothetical protein
VGLPVTPRNALGGVAQPCPEIRQAHSKNQKRPDWFLCRVSDRGPSLQGAFRQPWNPNEDSRVFVPFFA